MKSVMVNIAVMDYCSGSIKMYSTSFPTGWQTEDVEKWLCDNTDYKDSQCYFMCSEDEIDFFLAEHKELDRFDIDGHMINEKGERL